MVYFELMQDLGMCDSLVAFFLDETQDEVSTLRLTIASSFLTYLNSTMINFYPDGVQGNYVQERSDINECNTHVTRRWWF
jgi:hypothetical protein